MALFHQFGRKRYRPTDEPTDKASYRDARTHLKKGSNVKKGRPIEQSRGGGRNGRGGRASESGRVGGSHGHQRVAVSADDREASMSAGQRWVLQRLRLSLSSNP